MNSRKEGMIHIYGYIGKGCYFYVKIQHFISFFFFSLVMSGPRVSNEIRAIPLIQVWPNLTGKVDLLFPNPFCLQGIFLPTNSPLLLGWSIGTIRLWISTRRNTLCVKPMIIVSLFFGLFFTFFSFFVIFVSLQHWLLYLCQKYKRLALNEMFQWKCFKICYILCTI